MSPYSLVLQFYLLVGRPLFLTTKSFMGCPLPLSLTLTPLNGGTGGTKIPSVLTLRGIRCGGSRVAIRWLRMQLVWGLRRSRDASQPVNLSSVSLRWSVEWFWAVVYLWQDRRKSYVARVDILPECLLRAQNGRQSEDFRV